MTSVMAATLSMNVNSAPAQSDANGREHLHTHSGHSASVFDSDLFRNLPRLEIEWPKFGLGGPPRVESGGPEALHMEVQHFLYFTGSDVWRNWAFAHAGVVWSPAGLDAEGFALKLLISGGAYRYLSGALNDIAVIGRQYSMTVLPGWRFKRANLVLTVYAGYDLQQFRTFPDDLDTRLRGRLSGMRGTVELWHEPNATTMLAADTSLSTIGAGNYARIAYGWRVFDRFYLGPELHAYSSDQYRHARAGIHVTALKQDDREWSGAIGYANDNDTAPASISASAC